MAESASSGGGELWARGRISATDSSPIKFGLSLVVEPLGGAQLIGYQAGSSPSARH